MTSLVILEDEAPARARLEAALHRVAPELTIAAALDSITAAVEWFRHNPAPDLVLADVQLADGLSFEIFQQVTLTSPVVFCTAYDEYVVEAMAAGGIDYLLKPVKDDDLARAVARYRRLEGHFTERAERAERVRSVGKKLGEPRRILARRREGFVALALDHVAYFAVDDKQADVVTCDGQRFEIDQTLAELEAALDPMRFFRVNRQYLVAASAVAGFRPYIKGKLLVELAPSTASDVIVSQENAGRFRAWLRGD